MDNKIIIVGGGPAGLSAGFYSARARIKTILIEKLLPGGNMLITEEIENYPGFPDGISGIELAEKMKMQFLKFEGEIKNGEVENVSFEEEKKIIKLKNGETFITDVLIIATGSSRRKLNVEGEKKFAGKGVSYCAMCDGAFFKEKKIAVVGGGDSALEEAIYLTRFVSQCYLIHRRDDFRASQAFQKKLASHPKIIPVLSSVVEKIEGDAKVEKVIVKNVKTGKLKELKVNGVFISIGQTPNAEFLKGRLEVAPSGHIITNEKMETSLPGVFACGDVREKSFYQVVTACGDGATAAFSAEKYLQTYRNL